MRLFTLPGVFEPISDSWLLAAHLRRERLPRGAAVLDLCTGSGALAVTAARHGPEGANVTAVDVSRRALLTARLNARLNGTRVRTVRSDLFDGLGEERFDLIVSNPPYVPGPAASAPRGAARAWEGGDDGRLLLDRVCTEAHSRLRPGGALLIVHSSVCGEQATLDLLGRHGLRAAVVERQEGPLGPLLSARAAQLEATGLLAPGERQEQVLIIKARRVEHAIVLIEDLAV